MKNAKNIIADQAQQKECRRVRSRKSGGNCRRQRERKYDHAAKEQILIKYADLVKMIARRMSNSLPTCVETDDLISVGLVGLMDAAERFDPSKGFKFKTFAQWRIQGAMIDELRRMDWLPRGVRDRIKKIEVAREAINRKQGRNATDKEICLALAISPEELAKSRMNAGNAAMLCLDDFNTMSKSDKDGVVVDINSRNGSSPQDKAELASSRRAIDEVISQLPDRQGRVLRMYYFEELNLKEIGKIMKITESRVSQLHTNAIQGLKLLIKDNSKLDLQQLLA